MAAVSSLTPDRAMSALAGWSDVERWCERTLSIRNKAGAVVPLKLTPSQVKFNTALTKLRKRGVPARIIVLKPRQVHMSVGVSAAIFREVAFLPGQRAAVVGDSHKSASQIWGYYDQFYRSYHDPLPDAAYLLKQERRVQDAGVWFEGGGFVQTFSADNTNIGRSFSLRMLHLSEYAFWRDPAGVMTGLLQSVPDDPGTVVVIESTANGIGNAFQKRYLSAAGGQDEWVTLFFSWWEHPEYRMAPEDPAAFQRSLTDEEHELQTMYPVGLDQLCWRRWAIRNKCENNIERFRQEYPSNASEAFVSSGRPRYSMAAIQRQRIVDPSIVGGLARVQIGTHQRVVVEPRDRGELAIWAQPQRDLAYVIGADTSEGIDTSEDVGAGDPDYSTAHVLERDSGRVVARIRARMEPAFFGEQLFALGEYYNWAYIVPEVNNTGIATLEVLLRMGYPLDKIYTRGREPDDRRPPQRHQLGWRTTTITRPDLLSRLDRALWEMAIHCPDEITISELSSFVVKASGKAEAAAGCHDDTVISLALAVVGLESAPRYKIPQVAIQGVSPPRMRVSLYGGMATSRAREDD